MDPKRLEYLEKRAREFPNDTFARYALGMELAGAERYEDAAKAYAALRQDHPKYLATYYQLGKALEKLGKIAEARETYEAGMQVAQAAGNEHTRGELQVALEALPAS